jgi:hypothetical protein
MVDLLDVDMLLRSIYAKNNLNVDHKIKCWIDKRQWREAILQPC